MVNAPRGEDGKPDTESDSLWLVDHSASIPIVMKAIQEQQIIIEKQKSENILMRSWICSQDTAPEALCN